MPPTHRRARRPSSRPLARLVAGLVAALALALGATTLSVLPVLPVAPAEAKSTYLCTGWVACQKAGFSHAGYRKASKSMWWQMFKGHNCTNYVAYRMVKAGMPNVRPWKGTGNAYNWGRANRSITDQVPTVGSVAWFDKGKGGAGRVGHVAYVEQVISSTEIIVSEDSWNGDFHWRRITKSGKSWPSGFIHFKDAPATPVVTVTAAPTIQGVAAVGAPLTATPGTWSGPATFTYQWLVNGAPLAGATGQTFTPVASQRGASIAVQVSAIVDGRVVGTAVSAGTAPVVDGVMVPTEPPVISGEPLVDTEVSVSKGAWAPGPSARSVQWLADGQPIPGATGWRLRLTGDLVGRQVTAQVSGTRGGFAAVTATATMAGPVLAGTIEVTRAFSPAGRPVHGETLSVAAGAWAPGDAGVTYQWLRNGTPIPGATGPTHVLGARDVGTRTTARVEITRTHFAPASHVVDFGARVSAPSTVAVRATGQRRRAVVAIRVSAPGVTSPPGRVVLRVGGVSRTVRLVKGSARVVLTGLRPGRRPVVVTYAGTAVLTKGVARTHVRVGPA